MPFVENMGKNLNIKYTQKLLDSAKKSTANAIKTASKRAIQKTAKSTDDLIGNLTAEKITSVSNFSKHSKDDDANSKIEVQIKRYISSEERQEITDELWSVW